MESEKINYSFFHFFFFPPMHWPQIYNENIFYKDNRMDQGIFNQFLITEPSDSKPSAPDLAPAWKVTCPALQTHVCRVSMWLKQPMQGGFQGVLFQILDFKYCLQKPAGSQPMISVVLARLLHWSTGLRWLIDTAALAAYRSEDIWWFFIYFWVVCPNLSLHTQ